MKNAGNLNICTNCPKTRAGVAAIGWVWTKVTDNVPGAIYEVAIDGAAYSPLTFGKVYFIKEQLKHRYTFPAVDLSSQPHGEDIWLIQSHGTVLPNPTQSTFNIPTSTTVTATGVYTGNPGTLFLSAVVLTPADVEINPMLSPGTGSGINSSASSTNPMPFGTVGPQGNTSVEVLRSNATTVILVDPLVFETIIIFNI